VLVKVHVSWGFLFLIIIKGLSEKNSRCWVRKHSEVTIGVNVILHLVLISEVDRLAAREVRVLLSREGVDLAVGILGVLSYRSVQRVIIIILSEWVLSEAKPVGLYRGLPVVSLSLIIYAIVNLSAVGEIRRLKIKLMIGQPLLGLQLWGHCLGEVKEVNSVLISHIIFIN
jgi:hypothetical protein